MAQNAIHNPRRLPPTQISASLAQVLVVHLQTNYSRTVISNVGELNVTVTICVVEAEHKAIGSSIVHGGLNGETVIGQKLVRTIYESRMGANNIRSNSSIAFAACGGDTRVVLDVVEVGQALRNNGVVSRPKCIASFITITPFEP